MKEIVSVVLFSFVVELQANRLLQAQSYTTPCGCISPITGECSQFAPCPYREYCQTTHPTAPFYISCKAYPNAQCRFTGCGGCYEYFIDSFGGIVDCNVDICTLPSAIGPCDAVFPRYFYNSRTTQCEQFTYGGCSGNANNFESIEQCRNACKPPAAGRLADSCGVQGPDCMALGAPAGLCSDGKTCFFNCGGCAYANDANGNLVCTPHMISQDVCPVAGDICGTQGNECPAIRAAAFMCPDGTTCYANCGKCTYEDDGNNGLYCSSMIPRNRVCPL